MAQTDSTTFVDPADRYFQSWLHWEYKAYVGKTGYNYGFWNSNGTVNQEMVQTLTRTYATAIAGHGLAMAFNVTTGDFLLKFLLDTSISAPTEVYAYQQLHYPKGAAIKVTPAVLKWEEARPNYFAFTPTEAAEDQTIVTIAIKNYSPTQT